MQALLANQSPVSSIAYSNKMRVIYDGVEQDAELRKYPSGKVYFRTENAHFVPVGECGVLIPLTQNKSAIVDLEDYEYLMQWKWSANKDGNTFYARRSENWTSSENGERKTRTVFMHRLILGLTDPTRPVDHANGHGLDNRKENLRECTHAQNAWNRRKNKKKGFSYVKRLKKYSTCISPNGNWIHLGYFSNEDTAAFAYNEAAKKYFGEFAALNEVDESKVDYEEFKKVSSLVGIGFSSANSSGFRGVSWHKGNERWTACIRVNGKLVHLGSYTDKILAVQAYNSAAVQYFGIDAKLNQIPNG